MYLVDDDLYLAEEGPVGSSTIHLEPEGLDVGFDPSTPGRLSYVEIKNVAPAVLDTVFGQPVASSLQQRQFSIDVEGSAGCLPPLSRLSKLDLFLSSPVQLHYRAVWAAEAALIAHELSTSSGLSLDRLFPGYLSRMLNGLEDQPALLARLGTGGHVDKALQLGNRELDRESELGARIAQLLRRDEELAVGRRLDEVAGEAERSGAGHSGSRVVDPFERRLLGASSLPLYGALWRGMREDLRPVDDGFIDAVEITQQPGQILVTMARSGTHLDGLIARLVDDEGKELVQAGLFLEEGPLRWDGTLPISNLVERGHHVELVDIYNSGLKKLTHEDFVTALRQQWMTLAMALEDQGDAARSVGGRTAEQCRVEASKLR